MATEIPIKIQFVKSLSTAQPSRIVAVKADGDTAFSLWVTDKTGIPYPLKDLQNNVIITNTDGNLQITSSSTNTNINLASSILATINSALQSGGNISELVNDVGYLVQSDIINYTNEDAQDAVGTILVDTTTIDFTYNDTTPSISADVKLNSIDATHLANNINVSKFTNDSGYITLADVDGTDLTYSSSLTDGTIISSTGSDAIIPLASIVNAGLISPQEKQNIASAIQLEDLANVATSGNYEDLNNIPTTFNPTPHTHPISDIVNLQTNLDLKQDNLVSGTSIKTLEGQSLLGSGNINLTKLDVGLANVPNTDFTSAVAANTAKTTNQTHTGDATGATVLTLATVNSNIGSFGTASNVPQYTVNAKGLTTASANIPIQIAESQVINLVADLSNKQATLVSGTNIRTINGNTLLGATDLTIPVATDATTLAKGIVQLTGDLGGTADNPTTPTAIHKTGDEVKQGILTLSDGLKIVGNTTSTTATKVNVQENDGTINTISKSDLVNVVEVNDVPSLPLVGEVGKIYVVKNVNKIYRWNGTFYQELATDISGKEDIANKQNSLAVDGTGIKFPTVDAVNTGLALKADQIASFSQLATFITSSDIVFVNDIYRGGLFRRYIGVDAVDNGVIFLGVSGTKWKRIIQTDTPLLQWWGVSGDGIEDNTTQVNNAIIFCGINGYKYLNISGTIKITGRLNDYKNKVLFVGDGVFNNTYKGNYAESDVSDSEVSFSGKINKEGSLNKTLKIIKANTGLKIVVFGNSIAYGRDYSTQNPAGSFYEIVNNETNENSWYGNFLRQIQKKFSDKNISVINRAIPGYAVSDYLDVISSEPALQQPSWFTGGMTGKTWSKIMEDDAPDVIILEHGMNSGTDYLDYAKLFVDLTKTWAKVPEIVFMSTPTNNYIDLLGTDWAGAPRLSKLDVKNQQYILSNLYNSYLIDVAKIANIKRYGTDYRNFTFKPRTIEGFSFINGASVLGGGNLGVPSNGQVIVNRHSHAPKYYLDFNLKPSSAFTNIRIFTGSSFLIISPTNVTVYPYTTTVNVLPAVSQSYTLPIGVFTNIKVEFGDFLNLYIDKKLIVSSQFSAPVVNILDDIKIDITGTTGVSEISEFKYYESEFTKYKPTLTGSELWGEAGLGNNGNAINHPSLLGVSETYNPAVNEFVDYIYANSKTISFVDSIVGTPNQINVDNVDGVNTLSLPQSISSESAPIFGGLTIPYAIFDNGIRAYSIENNSTSVGMVDIVAGAFRWKLNSSGVFNINNLSGTGTRPIGATSSGDLVPMGVGYKVYTALLSQSGTSAPVATVLENTLGGTVVWTRNSTGLYTGTLAGVFTANKTFTTNTFGTFSGFAQFTSSSVNTVNINTTNSSITLTDGLLNGNSIEIRVYN